MTAKKEIPLKSVVFVVCHNRIDEGVLLINGKNGEFPSKYFVTREGDSGPVMLDVNPRFVFSDRVEALRCYANEIKLEIQNREKTLFEVQTELSKEIRKSWKKDDSLSL